MQSWAFASFPPSLPPGMVTELPCLTAVSPETVPKHFDVQKRRASCQRWLGRWHKRDSIPPLPTWGECRAPPDSCLRSTAPTFPIDPWFPEILVLKLFGRLWWAFKYKHITCSILTPRHELKYALYNVTSQKVQKIILYPYCLPVFFYSSSTHHVPWQPWMKCNMLNDWHPLKLLDKPWTGFWKALGRKRIVCSLNLGLLNGCQVRSVPFKGPSE